MPSSLTQPGMTQPGLTSPRGALAQGQKDTSPSEKPEYRTASGQLGYAAQASAGTSTGNQHGPSPGKRDALLNPALCMEKALPGSPSRADPCIAS